MNREVSQVANMGASKAGLLESTFDMDILYGTNRQPMFDDEQR